MTVSYWRELLTRGYGIDRKDPLSELGYRFSIQTDPNEPSNPMKGMNDLYLRFVAPTKAQWKIQIYG